MEEKTIDFETFWHEFSDFKRHAYKELGQRFSGSFTLNFYELQGGVYDDGLPTKIGVSVWSATTIDPETARVYSRALQMAAELADGFKYNGYIVTMEGRRIGDE